MAIDFFWALAPGSTRDAPRSCLRCRAPRPRSGPHVAGLEGLSPGARPPQKNRDIPTQPERLSSEDLEISAFPSGTLDAALNLGIMGRTTVKG